jgi:predicted RNA-binding Zn ribbon-like protein
MVRHQFDLSGGHLALDFANTMTSRHKPEPIERLTSYDELLAFAEQTHACTPAEAARLRAVARRNPGRARTAVLRARELREAIFAISSRWAQRRPQRESDLATLSAGVHRLVLDDDLTWTWDDCDGPDAVLAPMVRSAVDLLTSPERERIRMCEAEDCIWVFLDTTKNRSRRWCSMEYCGNRAKARRFYERHHG